MSNKFNFVYSEYFLVFCSVFDSGKTNGTLANDEFENYWLGRLASILSHKIDRIKQYCQKTFIELVIFVDNYRTRCQ